MPSMVAPPIEYLRDPEQVEKDTDAYWQRVIDELALRLEPQGLDINAIVDDILQDPRIQAEKKERADKNLLVRSSRLDTPRVSKAPRPEYRRGSQTRASGSQNLVCGKNLKSINPAGLMPSTLV
jgi:hypothetical protein